MKFLLSAIYTDTYAETNISSLIDRMTMQLGMVRTISKTYAVRFRSEPIAIDTVCVDGESDVPDKSISELQWESRRPCY